MPDAPRLQIDVDVDAVVARFGPLAGQEFDAALRGGMVESLDYAASEVAMTAVEHGLGSRSGSLLNSIQGVLDNPDELTGYVGVPEDSPAAKYAYLLTDETIEITPVTAGALTIPLEANLTPAGLPRYPTVAALKEDYGERVHRRGRAIGIEIDDRFVGYFGLAACVTVTGVDALEPGIDKAASTMRETIQARIDDLIGATE